MDNIKFVNATHKSTFHLFLEQISAVKKLEKYHLPLAYLLSLDETCRKHIDDVFNFERCEIKPECVLKEWQTGMSMRTVRLAFNLWNGFNGKFYAEDIGERVQFDPQNKYTVDEIFACSYAPYFYQAIKLRYPEYCGGDDNE